MSQAEFVTSEFETVTSDADRTAVVAALQSAIERLDEQIETDKLEEILRAEPGTTTLTSKDTRDQLDPEPFTKSALIEPLLDALGYDDYGEEAGSFAEERGMQADYSVPLYDTDVDSSRLLIEAEPLNKPLDTRNHGINQVQSWLSRREFETDFGFATDGLRWAFIRYDPDSYSHDIISFVDLQPTILELFYNHEQPPGEALTDDGWEPVNRLISSFSRSNFIEIATDARRIIRETQKAITDEFYEDYIRYVFGIINDEERTPRSLIGDGIVPPDGASGDDIRSFAVTLVNRLIFIKFLEDKHIVEPDLLAELKSTYQDGVYADRFYKEFLETLFFSVLNKHPDDRSSQIQELNLFSDAPYLNGGLFRPMFRDTESEYTEHNFDVRNDILFDIINLLEEYTFSADGGPTDLDPSVLGNVFEKTINYITADSEDRNKKFGAYYTPKEITRVSAERTVRPALFDRCKETLIEKYDWRASEFEEFDGIYDLIENGLSPNMKLINTLLDEVVDEFHAVDPACGSGHYLTSVVEEIVNIRQALYDRADSHPDEYRLKKTTVQNNIYGVDIMGPATEIAKLRLWLSIVAELQPGDFDEFTQEEIALPNITFNVRQGNSLIGYIGFPEQTNDGGYTLEKWNENSVRDRYEDIIEEIELHEEAAPFPEKAERHRQNANKLLREHRSDLDDKILDDFRDVVDDVGVNDIEEYDPFHWVLEFAEVYATGGFDVIVGNPPWEVLSSNRDEFFSRYDAEFRTRPLSEKDEIQAELLSNDDIADEWDEHKRRMDILATYFGDSEAYEHQSPHIGGQAKTDLAMLFLERVFEITDDGGYVAKLFPGKLFTGAGNKDLRTHLLSETAVDCIIGFENKGGRIFEEVDNRYRFGVVSFRNSGTTDTLRVKFRNFDLDILQDVDGKTFPVPAQVLREYAPNTRIFPTISRQEVVPILEKAVQHPAISDENKEGWYIDLYKEELNRSRDSDRFVEDKRKGDYPVYGGSNIWQFNYDNTIWEDIVTPSFWSVSEHKTPEKSAKKRIREKQIRRLKKVLYQEFDGSGSQIGFVNDLLENRRGEPLQEDDVLLDCTEYRIVIREIANKANERTCMAAVIPPGIVCHHKAPNIRPYEITPTEEDLTETPIHGVYDRIFTDEQLFATLGLLNSLPFDYLLRMKLDDTLGATMFEECQAPRLTAEDDWFEFIWKRAAQLNCYGDSFKEMRNRLDVTATTDKDARRELRAELEAAAFHAYGFTRAETEFIIDDFEKVRSPRIMDNQYYAMLLEKYDKLDPSS